MSSTVTRRLLAAVAVFAGAGAALSACGGTVTKGERENQSAPGAGAGGTDDDAGAPAAGGRPGGGSAPGAGGNPNLILLPPAAGGAPPEECFAVAMRTEPIIVYQDGGPVTVWSPLDCEWQIPPPPEGESFDPFLVNLSVTIGATTTKIPAVRYPSDCALAGQAWYYDDPGNPTTIHVCPETCAAIRGSPDTHVDIVFGCHTGGWGFK